MRLDPRLALLVACVATTTMVATTSMAGEGRAHACCARAASTQAARPASCASTIATLPGLPALMPPPATAPIVSGLRAFIDPETGMLTSTTPLDFPADVFTPFVTAENLPQVRLPDGSYMIDTRGIMLDNFVVQLDALGKRQFGCTQDPRSAAAPAVLPTPTKYEER